MSLFPPNLSEKMKLSKLLFVVAKFFQVLIFAVLFFFDGFTAADAQADASAKKPKAVSAAAKTASQEKTFDFALQGKVSVKELISYYALISGKNVVLDDTITGFARLVIPKAISVAEARGIFDAALYMAGFYTIETGKVIKVVRIKNAKTSAPNVKYRFNVDKVSLTDQFVIHLAHVKNLDVNVVAKTLSQLVPANSIIPFQSTNSLIVAASEPVGSRIMQILRSMDHSKEKNSLQFYVLKNTSAKQMKTHLQQMIKSSQKLRSHNRLSEVQIVSDDMLGRMAFFGRPALVSRMLKLCHEIDKKVIADDEYSSMKVWPLAYRDAKKMAVVLNKLSFRGRNPAKKDSSQFKIAAEESSNSLLISGSPSEISSALSMIKKLDYRKKQILVLVYIAEFQNSDGFTFGSSYMLGQGNDNLKVLTGFESQNVKSLVSAKALAEHGGKASVRQSTESVIEELDDGASFGVVLGKGIEVKGVGTFSPSAFLKLMSKNQRAVILDEPYFVTVENEVAKFSVGQTLLFSHRPEGSINTSTNKVKVDLNLEVEASATFSTNDIVLKMVLDSDQVLDIDSEGRPRLGSKKLIKKVTIKDGQTLVVSGLNQMRESETITKVPVLGDIPVLGALFRKLSTAKTYKKLIVMMSPHILENESDLRRIAKQQKLSGF